MRKIIGVTVGTPLSENKIKEKVNVSGQINTHNTNPAAHEDIRKLANEAKDPNNLTEPVPVHKGGTGAVSAADARNNLNVPSKADLTKTYDKLISMGEQLVVNGTGFMGNNTNFSWWDFDGSQGNGSPGSFTKAAKKGGRVQLDELIPVNATKAYEWKLDLKSEKGISTFYTFVQCYDADMQEINSYHVRHRSGSTTKLTKDLVAGDTVLHLEDVSGWLASMNNYTDAIVWNYKNSFGYAYPKETYSRTKLPLLVSDGNITIDTVNKTVALKTAYAGATIPAGTDLSQGTPGHSYKYYPLGAVTIPTEWTSYSGVLSGTEIFFPGAAYVRLCMFWNDNFADDRQWMTNVSFKEAVSGGVTTAEMNTAISNAVGSINTILDEINGEVV